MYNLNVPKLVWNNICTSAEDTEKQRQKQRHVLEKQTQNGKKQEAAESRRQKSEGAVKGRYIQIKRTTEKAR